MWNSNLFTILQVPQMKYINNQTNKHTSYFVYAISAQYILEKGCGFLIVVTFNTKLSYKNNVFRHECTCLLVQHGKFSKKNLIIIGVSSLRVNR